ncbi:MAG: Crp/Fnr family transcriptional regulator [Rhodothermales bacterium]
MAAYDLQLIQLRQAISSWVDLDDEEWGKFAGLFEQRAVSQSEYLLLPGDTVYELLFVTKGLLRFYYSTLEGAESNKAFIAENTFAGPLAASMLDLPVVYGVQALEETTLLVANYNAFVALFEHAPAFERLGRKFAEQLLMRKELRMRSLLQQNARERYIDFVAHHPDLIQRIPQYHIATYLGITDVSLSRLRRAILEETV